MLDLDKRLDPVAVQVGLPRPSPAFAQRRVNLQQPLPRNRLLFLALEWWAALRSSEPFGIPGIGSIGPVLTSGLVNPSPMADLHITLEDFMRTYWNFASAGDLVFGTDSALQLGRLITQRGWRRVLMVTDANLMRAGLVDRVRETLLSAGVEVEVFGGGRPEPDLATAIAAHGVAAQFRPTAILGLGGGSNLDLAKMTATLHAHGGSPEDYFGTDRIPSPTTPVIAVPTTAGTGSEVSHSAVFTDTTAGVKVSTLSRYLRPALAVVDPRLTLTCPARATADSGIDALTHAIEACTAIGYDRLDAPPEEPFPYSGATPLGDLLAAEAIRLVGRHLVTAVREPLNLPAREGMALAATLAGLAFSNCAVAVVHALEYPIGVALHVSHGAGNGLLLPYVMRFNLPTRTREFARIAEWLGADVRGLGESAAAEAAIVEVQRLCVAIGIPTRLREIGARADQLPGFAEKSFAIKRLMRLNPRAPSAADLLAILESAL